MNHMKAARLAANVGQAEAARAIGIGVPTLWRYENGTRRPDALTITRMADLYGCTTDALLGRSEVKHAV
jgi:transcriptional regulator with XRE-family HTH domain